MTSLRGSVGGKMETQGQADEPRSPAAHHLAGEKTLSEDDHTVHGPTLTCQTSRSHCEYAPKALSQWPDHRPHSSSIASIIRRLAGSTRAVSEGDSGTMADVQVKLRRLDLEGQRAAYASPAINAMTFASLASVATDRYTCVVVARIHAICPLIVHVVDPCFVPVSRTVCGSSHRRLAQGQDAVVAVAGQLPGAVAFAI